MYSGPKLSPPLGVAAAATGSVVLGSVLGGWPGAIYTGVALACATVIAGIWHVLAQQEREGRR